MKDAEIAAAILFRRNSISPIVLPGELREQLGEDGFETALTRRWIVPNYESGALSISQLDGILQEMRDLAATVERKPEPVVTPVNRFRLFDTNQRHMFVREMKDGALIEASDDAEIGDEVTVAEDGKAYTAVVKSKNADGSLSLSFGNEKPRTDRTYKAAEIRKTGSAPAAPSSSAPAAPVKPASPISVPA